MALPATTMWLSSFVEHRRYPTDQKIIILGIVTGVGLTIFDNTHAATPYRVFGTLVAIVSTLAATFWTVACAHLMTPSRTRDPSGVYTPLGKQHHTNRTGDSPHLFPLLLRHRHIGNRYTSRNPHHGTRGGVFGRVLKRQARP